MSFADELKRWVSPRSVGGQMALLLVVTSIVAAASGSVMESALLSPSDVLQEFKLWQLVSPTFLVPASPLTILFGLIIMLQTGAWLEAQWSRSRVWIFVFGVNLLANVATVMIGLLSPRVFANSFFGGYTTIEAMWIAQGLIVGPGRLNWFGFPVSGYAFAVIGAAFTLLAGITGSWVSVVPQLFGIAITVGWVQGYTPGQLLLRFRSRQLERDLRKRSAHLSVVKGQKNNRDSYLN
jgi:membrane associated rhomboid family serine protease